MLNSRRALRHVDDMPIGPDSDDDRVALLSSALVGRGSDMQLSAVPFTRHERVVFDHSLLEHGHIALAGFDRAGDHCMV